MSENFLSEHSVYKTDAFDVLKSSSSEYYTEFEEEISPVEIQNIERNFLKLFGIVL